MMRAENIEIRLRGLHMSVTQVYTDNSGNGKPLIFEGKFENQRSSDTNPTGTHS